MTASRVLAELRDALVAEAHVLASDPALIRQQVCNRLERRAVGDETLRPVLSGERGSRQRPWLRRLNAPRESDELVRTIPTGQEGVLDATLLPSGHALTTRGVDGSVATWDMRRGIRMAMTDDRVADRTESGGHGVDIDRQPQPVCFVDSRTGRQREVTVEEEGSARAFGGTGHERVLAVGPEGGDPRGEDIVYLAGHTAPVTCVCVVVADDGQQFVVSGSADATLRVWDPCNGDEVAVLAGHTAPVTFVAHVSAEPGGSLVSASVDDTIRLWRLPSGPPGHRAVGHQGTVTCAAISADGGRAVTGGEDGAAIVWDFATGTPAWSSAGFRAAVRNVALDAAGVTVAIGLADENGVLWDLERDVEAQSGVWRRPTFDGFGFVVHGPAGCLRLAPRHRLLGGTRWVSEQADEVAVGPARTMAEAHGSQLRIGACRFPCAAGITALAGDDLRGRFVCGDESGNVYLLQQVNPGDRPPSITSPSPAGGVVRP